MWEHYWLPAAAAGKVLAAWSEFELRARLVTQGLKQLTDATITSRQRLLAEMEPVRRQGYALDNEAYMAGGLCYAAPVFHRFGTTVLTVNYPQYNIAALPGPEIQQTAKRISVTSGWTE